jgi:hypothetical protein
MWIWRRGGSGLSPRSPLSETECACGSSKAIHPSPRNTQLEPLEGSALQGPVSSSKSRSEAGRYEAALEKPVRSAAIRERPEVIGVIPEDASIPDYLLRVGCAAISSASNHCILNFLSARARPLAHQIEFRTEAG